MITTEQLTTHTTFFALTAPGYTLEDQVLGEMTLREWLHHFSGSDAGDKLADHIMYYVNHNERYWFSRQEAMDYKFDNLSFGQPEPFTPASLLARLREMGEEANEL